MDREEALNKSDEALKELSSALEQGKSEKLIEYLEMMSRFHNYSFGNCILIAMQKPEATLVAGFGKWKEMNRFVKKHNSGQPARLRLTHPWRWQSTSSPGPGRCPLEQSEGS